MKRQIGRWLVVCILALCVSGCGRSKASITLAGSTAFQPFAEKLAELYMSSHPEANITVQGGGSAVGVQSALSGAAQIGMADLVDLPPEAKPLTATVVAKDGIAVVVNPANKIKDLTTAQLRSIFNGQTTNWKDVGGDDRPVTVVSREAGSGTRSSFERILGGIDLTPNAVIQNSNGTVRETIAADANSIGYLSHGLLNDKIKAVRVDGHGCTTEDIVKGEYALVRPIYLLTKGEPQGQIKSFIDYILSPEGQEIISTSGLLPAK
jgi:phosphate transport system substrate-binding protein